MSKKPLLSLFILPFLLVTGCDNSKKATPTAGQKGEEVLQGGQKAALFAQEQKLSSEAKLNRTFVQSEGWTFVQNYNPFKLYSHTTSGTVEKAIVSPYAGQIGSSNKYSGYDVTAAFSATTYTLAFAGANMPAIYWHESFASAGGLKSNSNTLKDALGNTLWTSPKAYADIHVSSVSTFTRTEYESASETYQARYVKLQVYTAATASYEIVILRYTNDMMGVETIQGWNGGESIQPQSTVEMNFTKDKMNYWVRPGQGGSYTIHHADKKGNEIVNELVMPAAYAGAFVNDSYIFQTRNEVDKHAENVTYFDTTLDKAWAIETYRINLDDLSVEHLDFPFVISTLSHEKFLSKNRQPNDSYTIPQYAVAELQEIKDQRLYKDQMSVVIDRDLVLHDDVTRYTNMYHLGTHYYDVDSRMFLNAGLEPKATLDGSYSVIKWSSEYMLVQRSGSGDYGIVDEEGKFVLPAIYSLLINNGNMLVLQRGEEKLAVDLNNPKNAVYYSRIETGINQSITLEKGVIPEGETEYDPDVFWYGNVKLMSVPHFTGSASANGSLTLQGVDVTTTFVSITYVNSSSENVIASFILANSK